MKRNLYLMYSINFLQGMVFYASIATLYRQAGGISVFQITLIESVSLLLSLAFEIPWGVLADRIGYRRTVIVCNALYFVSKIIFWKARGFGGFLLERVLLAVIVSGLSGVDTSILYLSCREDESQRVFGIYQGLGTAGLLSAAAVYSLFIGEDYRAAGFLTVVTYGVAALLSLGIKEVRPSERGGRTSLGHSLAVLRETISNRSLLFLIAGTALLHEVNQTITVFLNQLQYTRSGMPVRLISGAYILMMLCGLLSVLSAPLTKRLRPKFFGGALFALCGLACLALAFTENPLLSVFGILLIRVCYSLMSPLGTRLQNEAVTTPDRATALSMGALIADVLAVFTNLVFGKLAEADLSGAMCFGAFLCVLGALLYLGGLRGKMQH